MQPIVIYVPEWAATAACVAFGITVVLIVWNIIELRRQTRALNSRK